MGRKAIPHDYVVNRPGGNSRMKKLRMLVENLNYKSLTDLSERGSCVI